MDAVSKGTAEDANARASALEAHVESLKKKEPAPSKAITAKGGGAVAKGTALATHAAEEVELANAARARAEGERDDAMLRLGKRDAEVERLSKSIRAAKDDAIAAKAAGAAAAAAATRRAQAEASSLASELARAESDGVSKAEAESSTRELLAQYKRESGPAI